MPGESHSNFGSLDDPLLVEEINLPAQGGATDRGHQVGVDEAPQAGTLSVELGDEIAFSLMGDPDGLLAGSFHLLVLATEEVAAFLPEHLEHGLRHDPFQNEVALFLELAAMFVGDGHDLFLPYLQSS